MRSRSVIYLALAAGVFMLSASGVFAKVARAPAGIIAFYRLFFATLALLPWLLSHKNDRRELRSLSPIQYAEGALAGFFLAVHYVMWFESLRYTSVASSTVLAALQPLFSVIWGRLFLGERLGAHALTGGAIAIAGSAVVGWSDFSVSSQSLWGDLLALVSGGVISLYFFCGQILRRRMGAVPYSVLSYGSRAAVLALYALFMGYPVAGYPASTWGAGLDDRRADGVQRAAQVDLGHDRHHGDPRRTGRHLLPRLAVSRRNALGAAGHRHRRHPRRAGAVFRRPETITDGARVSCARGLSALRRRKKTKRLCKEVSS